MTVNASYPVPSRPMAATKSATPSAQPPGFDDAVSTFLAEAKKSPMERIKEAILKKHGLTEEQFEQLPAEKQTQIQREIEETMKQKMKGADALGTNANVLA